MANVQDRSAWLPHHKGDGYGVIAGTVREGFVGVHVRPGTRVNSALHLLRHFGILRIWGV